MNSRDTAASLGELWRSATGTPPSIGMTVRERVAQELRHRILLGRLTAGSRVDLDELSAELGVSRTPIREACLELANDGLLRMAPRSGITVLGITERDLLDNFELMASLAGLAAGYASERADLHEKATIAALAGSVEEASRSRGDVATANFEFHRSINRACHAPRVTAVIARAARLFPDRMSDAVPSQVPCSLVEHSEIVAAIESSDSSLARQLTENHFRDAAARLRAHLASE